MRPGKLVLATLLAVVLIVVCSVGGLVLFNTTRMLPQHGSLLYVGGLQDRVEVLWDAWGIPHIYASNAHDLFFAQGYLHAQDRWWQMEFQRHVGQGRIAELTGYNPAVVGNDLFIRTAGWRQSAEADLAMLDSVTRAALDSYAAGVNAYIGGRPGGDLALEYTLLGLNGVGIEVEPWEPVDTLFWAKALSWDQSGNRGRELESLLLADLSSDLRDAYFVSYPYDQRPTILTTDDLSLAETAASARQDSSSAGASPGGNARLAGGVTAYTPFLGSDESVGSNSWAIGGQNTASGMPILANDPHIGIQMPSTWYEIGLHCRPVSEDCPYDLVGFSVAGTPLILIGHNGQIAWGLTNAIADTQDLYQLRINPENPLQYEYNGAWRDMQVTTEVIHLGSAYRARADDPNTAACEGIADLPINADGDLEIQVRRTHFGPIMTDNTITDDCRFVAQDNEAPLAMRWTGLEPGNQIGALRQVAVASNWDEFRQALADWPWPTLTFLYADAQGNIGLQLPGSLPIRAPGHDGTAPVPGWTDEYEWQGYIPFDALPNTLNPARGWIVTANHAVVPPEYYTQLAARLGEDATYAFSQETAFGYRAARIVEMVRATTAHTPETVAEIQGDNHSLSAEELLPYLLDVPFEDAALADAAVWLASWDLQTHMDSPQAALWQAFWAALVENLWNDQLGFAHPGGDRLAWATRLLMDQPEHPWWDDTRTTDVVETRDDILARALQEALDAMTAAAGTDRTAWRWGDLHTATFVSSPLGLSGIGFVENLVNAGPVPVSGSWDTVNRTNWVTSDPYAVRGAISSMRMIVDFGNLDDSRAMHPTGQSGHPLSDHYRDMVDPWRHIHYHPMLFSREAVEEAAVERLDLRPAPLSAPPAE